MSPALALLIIFLTLTADLCLADGQPVSFLDMTSEVPADWIASEPSSDMRLLQFTCRPPTRQAPRS